VPVYANGIENDGLLGYTDEAKITRPCVTVSARGTIGFSKERKIPFFPVVRLIVIIPDFKKTLSRYLEILFNHTMKFEQYAKATPQLTVPQISEYKIPLPPKDVQEKIVAEIEKIEKNENKIQESLNVLKQTIFSLVSSGNDSAISSICSVSSEKINPQDNPSQEFVYLGLEHIESATGIIAKNTALGRSVLSAKNVFHKGDILYGKLRPYLNKVALADCDGICSTDILVLRTSVPRLLKYILLSPQMVNETSNMMKGVSLPRIGIVDFLNLRIALPTASEWEKLNTEIEKLETQIHDLQKQFAETAGQKELVLKKYL
jgi:type I restriction enzyme M protein